MDERRWAMGHTVGSEVGAKQSFATRKNISPMTSEEDIKTIVCQNERTKPTTIGET